MAHFRQLMATNIQRRMIHSLSKPKISLIGSGQIGSILALMAGIKHLGDVHLVDVSPGISQGKALDLNQLKSIENLPNHFTGSSSLETLRDSNVAIITAGIPRKPGMSRDDVLSTNAKIIKDVAHSIKKYCPSAFVICVTNPLDTMTHLLQQESQLPSEKVVGMAGVLDSSRFQYFLSEKLNISAENISTLVLGGHGDSMVPLIRYTTVFGVPLPEIVKMGLLTDKDVEEIIQRTRFGGQEIVNLLRNGSAFFSPAVSAIQMAEAYLLNKRMVLPCAAKLAGEYGVSGYYVGVPVIIGANGVEKIIELPLNKDEMLFFKKSVDDVKNSVDKLKKVVSTL